MTSSEHPHTGQQGIHTPQPHQLSTHSCLQPSAVTAVYQLPWLCASAVQPTPEELTLLCTCTCVFFCTHTYTHASESQVKVKCFSQLLSTMFIFLLHACGGGAHMFKCVWVYMSDAVCVLCAHVCGGWRLTPLSSLITLHLAY